MEEISDKNCKETKSYFFISQNLHKHKEYKNTFIKLLLLLGWIYGMLKVQYD